MLLYEWFEWFNLRLMFHVNLMFLDFERLLMMWDDFFSILSLVINSFSRLYECFLYLWL
jgi:hypothetical protein